MRVTIGRLLARIVALAYLGLACASHQGFALHGYVQQVAFETLAGLPLTPWSG